MARVQYGSLVTGLKGKIGGHVFQRCGQSGSLRTKSTVISSQSTYAQDTRNQFGSLANLWHGLTAAQRNQFANQASSYPTFDSYGNPIILTGYQLFMYINRPMLMAGFPIIEDCYAYIAPTTYFTYVEGIYPAYEEFFIAIDGIMVEPLWCLVYASAPMSPPRHQTWPKMSYMGKGGEVDVSSVDISAAYYSRYANMLIEGYIVYLEYWFLDTTTGCMKLGNRDYYTISLS